MARRVIAIPLAVAIAIAVFSSFCFAVIPDNTISNTYSVNCLASFGNNDLNQLDSAYFPVGSFEFGTTIMEKSFVYINFGLSSSYATILTMSNTFELNIGRISDLYIMVRSSALSSNSINFDDLLPFYDPSSNLTHSFTVSCDEVNYIVDSSGNFLSKQIVRSFSEVFNVTFLHFKNVPIGTYSVVDSSSGGSVTSGNYTYTYSWLTFGVFGSGLIRYPDSYVDDFINGDSSFIDSVNSINQSVQDLISSSSDPVEQTLAVVQGSFALDVLVNISNDNTINNVHTTLTPNLNQTINNYVSGSLSLDDALSDMSQQYTAALNSAETPEQGTFINTTYLIKMQQFEIEASRKLAAEYDSFISEDDMQASEDYFELEDELFSRFDFQAYKDSLEFDTWYNQMSPVQVSNYKSIFDYILNESSVRYYVTIPLTMVIVSILLATTIKVGRRS